MRGPNLSLSIPAMTPATPPTIILSEKAPEVAVLVHPISSISGLKNNAKEDTSPSITIKIRKEIATMM